jgi:hypothetical protein
MIPLAAAIRNPEKNRDIPKIFEVIFVLGSVFKVVFDRWNFKNNAGLYHRLKKHEGR